MADDLVVREWAEGVSPDSTGYRVARAYLAVVKERDEMTKGRDAWLREYKAMQERCYEAEVRLHEARVQLAAMTAERDQWKQWTEDGNQSLLHALAERDDALAQLTASEAALRKIAYHRAAGPLPDTKLGRVVQTLEKVALAALAAVGAPGKAGKS